MRTDLIAALLMDAMVGPVMAFGADPFADRGTTKIRAGIGPNCSVSLEGVGQVKTRHGVEQYWVSYYPPQSFPGWGSDLEVKKIVGKVR